MLAPSHQLAVLLLLAAIAGTARAECDQRNLPRPDTLSVEAAAREASGGKLPDIHVRQACITGTTTLVTLVSASRSEEWEMTCVREQSTWYKRGGWKCDAPARRRSNP